MRSTDRFDSVLQYHSEQVKVDWRIMKRVMLRESEANPKAISRAGAQGLMQCMPATWTELMGEADPFNPEESIRFATRYMAQLLRQFGNDYAKALAAYNWGMGNVGGAIRRLGGMWRTALPAETEAYVRAILPGAGGPDHAG